jgi:hypothetical protein
VLAAVGEPLLQVADFLGLRRAPSRAPLRGACEMPATSAAVRWRAPTRSVIALNSSADDVGRLPGRQRKHDLGQRSPCAAASRDRSDRIVAPCEPARFSSLDVREPGRSAARHGSGRAQTARSSSWWPLRWIRPAQPATRLRSTCSGAIRRPGQHGVIRRARPVPSQGSRRSTRNQAVRCWSPAAAP